MKFYKFIIDYKLKLQIEMCSSNFKNQTFVLFMLCAIIGAIIA